MKTLTPQILAMYLGCKVQTIHRHYPDPTKKSVRKVGTVMDIDLVINKVGVWFPEEEKENLVNFEPSEVKPILRRLEDMTEEEDQIEFPKNNRGQMIDMHWHPEGFAWLLSKGFDLFGLLDSGLAVKEGEGTH